MKIETKEIGSYSPKQVVCYSGGHSSAIVAINAVKNQGAENVVLLNHDINPNIETSDTKRFKNDVAEYLGTDITYANHANWETATPTSVCVENKGFKFGNSPIQCTKHLKTEPFKKWINENDPLRLHTYLYGFDANEQHRVNRRIGEMAKIGCKTDYPIVTQRKNLKIINTVQIDIDPPNNYENFKHANCQGCLKAGWQHWYIINAHRKDIWEEAKQGEETLGHAVHKNDKGIPVYFEEYEELFYQMYLQGIPTTEHIPDKKFWATVRRDVKQSSLLCQVDDAMRFDNTMACTSCTG